MHDTNYASRPVCYYHGSRITFDDYEKLWKYQREWYSIRDVKEAEWYEQHFSLLAKIDKLPPRQQFFLRNLLTEDVVKG